MKKSVTMVTLLLLIAGMLLGCGHQHVWKEATCTERKTCTECGAIEGDLARHTWMEATCSAPKTCSVCGETEGSALEHTWMEATCSAPKTCSVCRETEGSALEHTWMEATCITPKTCSVCGETEGELAEHDLNSSGKCTVCGEQIGFALNMSNYTNYLKITYLPYSTAHNWEADGREFTMEPIANVTFVDVKVTFLDVADKEHTFDVSSTGYAHGSISYSSRMKLISISGYVIE